MAGAHEFRALRAPRSRTRPASCLPRPLRYRVGLASCRTKGGKRTAGYDRPMEERAMAKAANSWPSDLGGVEERAVSEADYEQLWRLHVDAMRDSVAATYGWVDEVQGRLFRDGWQQRLAQRVLVDGPIVAAWLIERKPDGVFLTNVEVASSHQRRGIGTVIVRRALVEAAAAGLPARLRVLKSNPDARRLYARHGFGVERETATHFYMVTPG
jgi:ribosomal protein S18 acetylase RimI-like enzyme